MTESGRRDEVEAAALYDLLSQSVAPLFYDSAGGEPPARWLEMVAHTLRTLGPKAQATRMVREYTTELYQPAAVASRALAGPPVPGATAPDGGRPEYGPARELAAWKDRVRKAWQGIAIEHVEADDGEQMPGARLAVSAVVALGELTPDDVTVEVVYGRVGDEDEMADPAHAALALESPPDGQSACPLRRRGRAGRPRAVRLHRPGAARAPAAGHPGRAWPGYVPGCAGGLTQR